MATARIAIRTDTAANWTSADTVLETGEQGYETDTGRRKIGDGTTAWTSLAYIDADLVANDHLVGLTATQTLTNKTLTSPIIGTGAYFGGTATANLLDDYEEGTWTPTLLYGTCSINEAWYTKVGQLVTVYASIVHSTDGSTGTSVTIQSLPFPPDGNSVCPVYPIGMALDAGDTFAVGLVSSTGIALGGYDSGSGIDSSRWLTGASVRLTATYKVA